MTDPAPRISVRVLWGQRSTTLEDCSIRTERTIALLQASSPAFARWGQKADSLKKALRSPLTLDRDGVAKLVSSGIQRTEVSPRRTMTDLGYSISLWNQFAEGVSANVSIQDGSVVPGVGNIVHLAASREAEGAPVTGETFLSILRGLADIWIPDRGDLTLDAPRPPLLGMGRKRAERVLARWGGRTGPLAGQGSGHVRITWAGGRVLSGLAI